VRVHPAFFCLLLLIPFPLCAEITYTDQSSAVAAMTRALEEQKLEPHVGQDPKFYTSDSFPLTSKGKDWEVEYSVFFGHGEILIDIMTFNPITHEGVMFGGPAKEDKKALIKKLGDRISKLLSDPQASSSGASQANGLGADSSNLISLLPGDTSKLDVAGVRLGMTPDEAIDALRKFSNWPVLKKRYAGPSETGGLNIVQNSSWVRERGVNYSGFGDLGSSVDCIKQQNTKDMLLVAVIASKANRTMLPLSRDARDYIGVASEDKSANQMFAFSRHTDPKKPYTKEELEYPAECNWEGIPQGLHPGDDPLEVAVYFSPTPGKEHVIAVSLWSSLSSPPLVEAIKANAFKKYGTAYSSLISASNGGNTTISWRFDRDGKLYPEAAVGKEDFQKAHPGPSGFGMNAFSNLNRVGLDFEIHTTGNPNLAGSYAVALFNEKEMFAWSSQLNSASKVIIDKWKQEELDKAKQSGAQVKF